MHCTGLTTINVELTSRCNKACWMCGRRERDRERGDLAYGDMEFALVERIAAQVEPGMVVQLHNNGEPLLYPRFGEAARLFAARGCLVNTVSNGKLLVEKADEVIGVLDTLAISVFENDEEADAQFPVIEEFLRRKGTRKPFTMLRFIGQVDEARYAALPALPIRRLLHAAKGSVEYRRRNPTIPEIGVCLDFLHHLAIDRHGEVSVCVRFDPQRELVLGSIREQTLAQLWQSPKRLQMKELHCAGRRGEIPYCGDRCSYWGVPTGE